MEFCGAGEFVSARVTAYLQEKICGICALEQYGELVLGCTHFNYFKDTFRASAAAGIHIIDGSLGTVRQLMRVLCSQRGALRRNPRRKPQEGRYGILRPGGRFSKLTGWKRIRKLHERLEQMRAL